MKSRRDFLKLVAAGSAAASLGRAGRAAAASTAKSHGAGKSAPSAHGTRSAAVENEIKKEKKSTDDVLKTIRGREIATTTPLAFVFRPMKARKGGHS